MMRLPQVTFTLISDGSSDCMLVPILRWTLYQTKAVSTAQGHWANLRILRPPPNTLSARMIKAVDLYPCDLLFVHRDAERQDSELRYDEIAAARSEADSQGMQLPVICVVPIRMQEAWLLFDEMAIRHAAGNPNGRTTLRLFEGPDAEALPNPKEILRENLRTACELRGRHLVKFRRGEQAIVHRVCDAIDDFAPLRTLSAFQRLETDIRACLATLPSPADGRVQA